MKKYLFTLLLVTSLAQAEPRAYPPHIILPNTPHIAPSGLTPAQVLTAYGFNYLPFKGDNQTVAIIDAYDDPSIEADLGTFDSQFNLPACTTANGCFTKVYASGSQPASNASWSMEIALDVEWVHAIAPNAKILLVEATDNSLSALFAAIAVAIQRGATTLSLSWGTTEFSSQTTFDATLRTYIVNGATIFAAAGDNGHQALFPASSTYTIAVGGTHLNVDSAGNYISETAWSGSGGGLSAIEPETGPQVNFPIPNDSVRKRGIPDVAYNADPATGYSVYDSNNSGWQVVGGTSAGAPQWAALVAIAKSGTHKRLSGIYTILYNIAKMNSRYYYNDITSGTNGSCGYYCTAQVGYDYVTGLGTPQVYFLVGQLIYYGVKK